MGNPRMIDGVLRLYINALIVNTMGDPVRAGEEYPNYEEVLETFYDFDDEVDVQDLWFDDSEDGYMEPEGDSSNEQS